MLWQKTEMSGISEERVEERRERSDWYLRYSTDVKEIKKVCTGNTVVRKQNYCNSRNNSFRSFSCFLFMINEWFVLSFFRQEKRGNLYDPIIHGCKMVHHHGQDPLQHKQEAQRKFPE